MKEDVLINMEGLGFQYLEIRVRIRHATHSVSDGSEHKFVEKVGKGALKHQGDVLQICCSLIEL